MWSTSNGKFQGTHKPHWFSPCLSLFLLITLYQGKFVFTFLLQQQHHYLFWRLEGKEQIILERDHCSPQRRIRIKQRGSLPYKAWNVKWLSSDQGNKSSKELLFIFQTIKLQKKKKIWSKLQKIGSLTISIQYLAMENIDRKQCRYVGPTKCWFLFILSLIWP